MIVVLASLVVWVLLAIGLGGTLLWRALVPASKQRDEKPEE